MSRALRESQNHTVWESPTMLVHSGLYECCDAESTAFCNSKMTDPALETKAGFLPSAVDTQECDDCPALLRKLVISGS